MPGAVRSSCVAAGTIADGQAPLVYTVPPGFTFILKSVAFGSTSQVAFNVALQLYTTRVPANPRLAYLSWAPTTPVGWAGWIVLEPTDSVQIQPTGSGAFYWVSGALLPD